MSMTDILINVANTLLIALQYVLVGLLFAAYTLWYLLKFTSRFVITSTAFLYEPVVSFMYVLFEITLAAPYRAFKQLAVVFYPLYIFLSWSVFVGGISGTLLAFIASGMDDAFQTPVVSPKNHVDTEYDRILAAEKDSFVYSRTRSSSEDSPPVQKELGSHPNPSIETLIVARVPTPTVRHRTTRDLNSSFSSSETSDV
ncbi:hypothetical protein SJAG_03803 [Schizosaccharomyces japonicus yFS275]|uniref:Uncharacterized protein n=1 Tax=Schizosaccharomyces japonicus (strain yFS275 / FY16936) TaxID=402676 RepID=B6K537_SCHJY|nr:hypothetical protein SJAG_03803 [Schizosaccharomyces japonicus yFS275]EEB08641.1 hypothetical protein SJAG_03803 [Schizosaccharomyces japonicus yFS275]